MEASPAAAPFAELIVRNGRQQGTRRPLREPVTIVGSTKGCDVRLDVDTVRPIHCVIALTSDGPCVRSWGTDDTFVNGTPCATHPLRDGDSLRIGPFEFEIRWTVPLALAAEPETGTSIEPTRSVDAGSSKPKDLLLQLGEARMRFRREKAEFEADSARQLDELTATRDELEQRDDELTRQRSRLLLLRGRFIKRWKRHWSTQRQRLAMEVARFHEERSAFEEERAEFEHVSECVRARAEVEDHRIEHEWERLRVANRQAKDAQAGVEAELERRRQALAADEGRLLAERHSFHAEQLSNEHHVADLRIEADGLESRVVNLRAVLLALEQARAGLATADSPSLPLSADSATTSIAVNAPAADLERIAEDLADQRYTLSEQMDRLALAREMWREEQSRMVADMAQLAEQLHRRQDRLVECEKAACFEREHLDRESQALQQQRKRLDVRRSQLEAIEATWRSELGRRDFNLSRWARHLERREAALGELFRRWSRRRHQEIAQLRDEQRRSEEVRRSWTRQIAEVDNGRQAAEERQLELAARALTLEKARQQLVEATKGSPLAAKRLERLDRHVHAAAARAQSRIDRSRQMLQKERAELDNSSHRANRQIEEAAIMKREADELFAELDLREFLVAQKEYVLREANANWSAERNMFERETNDLREEMQRLSAVLVQTSEAEPLALARAA